MHTGAKSLLPSPVAEISYALQENAGPMTLEGTQSFVIATGDGGVVIVDPGDDDAAHQSLLAAAGRVDLILVTHRHHDHVGGLARLRELTGAPSRGLAQEFSVGAPALRDGEVIRLGGPAVATAAADGNADGDAGGDAVQGAALALRVLATPGHTSDSISLVLERGGDPVAVLTGDTILGHGTTIIDHPDGDLGAYLDSLAALRELGAVQTLPAHGGFPGALEDVATAYLNHRTARLEQVRAAAHGLAAGGVEPSIAAVTDIVYADVPAGVRPAAEHTVAAQLDLLARRGQMPPATS